MGANGTQGGGGAVVPKGTNKRRAAWVSVSGADVTQYCCCVCWLVCVWSYSCCSLFFTTGQTLMMMMMKATSCSGTCICRSVIPVGVCITCCLSSAVSVFSVFLQMWWWNSRPQQWQRALCQVGGWIGWNRCVWMECRGTTPICFSFLSFYVFISTPISFFFFVCLKVIFEYVF